MMNVYQRYIDILTCLSCVYVVILHANGIFWKHPTGMLWITSNILETVFYFAVPIFFMISGATLMDYRDRYSTKDFFIKRGLRTLIPFIAWSLIWYVLSNHPERMLDNGSLILAIINVKILYIYWFFIPLFACYMSIPVLSSIPKEKRISIFSYLAILGFISYSIIPFCEEALNITINHDIQIPLCAGYLLYILLGYIFTRVDISPKYRRGIYILGFIGLFLHCYMTIILSPEGTEINKLFKGYLNFPCVLYSSAVFIFIKYTDWEFIYNNRCTKFIIQHIKECSLGIYLIHQKILSMMSKFYDITAIEYRTIGALLVVVICVTIVLCIKKIPILKRTL